MYSPLPVSTPGATALWALFCLVAFVSMSTWLICGLKEGKLAVSNMIWEITALFLMVGAFRQMNFCALVVVVLMRAMIRARLRYRRGMGVKFELWCVTELARFSLWLRLGARGVLRNATPKGVAFSFAAGFFLFSVGSFLLASRLNA